MADNTDRIYEKLMEMTGSIGAVQAVLGEHGKKLDSMDTRLAVIESKPAETLKAGKMAVIAAGISAACSALVSAFMRLSK